MRNQTLRGVDPLKSLLIGVGAVAWCASQASAQRPLPRWTLADEVRFGDDSRDETTLTGGRHVIVGRDGSVFIAQPADGAIRTFSATGAYIRTIGRKGQGPGEFQDLQRVGFVRDTLWALDSRTSRVSFFSLAGKYLRSERISAEGRGEFFPSLPWTLLSSGTVVSFVSSSAERMPGTKISIPIIRIERSGRVLDTIARRESANSTGEVQFRGATKGKLVFSQPFSDGPILAAEQNGNGFAIIDTRQDHPFSTSFAVSRYGATGQLVSQARVPFQPVELTSRMADSAARVFLAGPRQLPVQAADILRAL